MGVNNLIMFLRAAFKDVCMNGSAGKTQLYMGLFCVHLFLRAPRVIALCIILLID